MKNKTLKKILGVVVLTLCGLGLTAVKADLSELPFADDFESYDIGTPLTEGTNGWYSSDDEVKVQDEVVFEGTKAAQVAIDSILSNQFDTNTTALITNVWVEMYVVPSRYTGADEPVCEEGVASAFYLDGDGFFVLRDSEDWIVADGDMKGNEVDPVEVDEWVLVNCFLDYTAKEWHLFKDGVMLRGKMGFADTDVDFLSSIDLYNGSGPTTYVDKVHFSTAVPPGLLGTGFPADWAPPEMGLLNTTINLDAFPGQQGVSSNFSIQRVSGSDIFFTASSAQSWIELDRNSGLVEGSNIESVTVTVDATGFNPGVYTGYVQVTAADDVTGVAGVNSPQEITVVMTVYPRASLTLSTLTLAINAIEGGSGTADLDVWNATGDFSLEFTTDVETETGGNWLSVLPVSGSSDDEDDKVALVVTGDALSLDRGSYTGKVTVTGTMLGGTYDADNSPLEVEVVLNVTYPVPELGVNPILLSQQVMHGANGANQIVNVWNANSNYTLLFEAEAMENWFDVTPDSGSSTGETTALTISYDVSGLAAGVHTGVVVIAGTDAKYEEPVLNSPRGVAVQVEIYDPEASAWIAASDDLYTDRVFVQWDAMSEVSTCEVWRAETDAIESAIKIATLPGLNNSHDDSTAVAGQKYFYWVRGVNAYGYPGAYSASDEGVRKLSPPATIDASKDTYEDKVMVSWSAAAGAPAGYQVWRNEQGGIGAAIGTSAALTFEDTTAVPGVRYSYWVRATNEWSESSDGPFAEGWRRISAPVNITATEGTENGKVIVAWDAVAGAAAYQVSRDDTPYSPIALTTYTDNTAAALTGYNYKVRAMGAVSTSAYSSAVLGWTALGDPVAVQASKGTFNYKVAVTWSAFGGQALDSYEVQRSEAESFETFDVIGTEAGVSYDDTTAVPGQTYYYRVRGLKGALHWLSRVGDGWRSLSAPAGVAASQATWADGILVSWQAVSGAATYEVWRNTENDNLTAAKIADVAGDTLQYGDVSVPSGATRYYWLKSRSAAGVSPYSNVAQGRAPVTVTLGGPAYLPVPGDYDGDGIDDLCVYAGSGGVWKVRLSGLGGYLYTATGFGDIGFMPVQGDYDGDGLTDPAVFRESTGTWRVWMSRSGYAQVAASGFGGPGAVPVPADYDGDGLCDPAVFYPATSVWRVWMSRSGYAMVSAQWGGAGFIPSIAGDADGDRKADLVVYNPATKTFKALCSALNYAQVALGNLGGADYLPINADYDGDRLVDASAYDASTGTWKVWGSRSGYSEQTYTIGGPEWEPAPLDYYGTGKANLCVYRASTGTWWIRPW